VVSKVGIKATSFCAHCSSYRGFRIIGSEKTLPTSFLFLFGFVVVVLLVPYSLLL